MSKMTWFAGLGLVASVGLTAPLSLITISPEFAMVPTASPPARFTATGLYADATTGRLTDATLSAGGNHTCAVVHDGGVRCWGQNGLGQLGTAPATTQSAVPLKVPNISTATAVAGGFQFSCAVLTGGSVRCWGSGTSGQLGNNGFLDSATPVTAGLSDAVTVAAGFQHACALQSTGTVRCWGENGKGQLGNGLTTDSATPVAVSGITAAVGLTVSGDFGCAVLADGGMRCWGANNVGQLGNGSVIQSSLPVPVTGISTAVSAGSGFEYACALLAGGAVRCWGAGLSGQLGNGAFANSSTPVPVTLPLPAVAVAAGSGLSHMCAVLTDDTLQCWGDNGNGQLGRGTVVGSFSSPSTVIGISGAVNVTIGFSHTCATLINGNVRCWGINSEGQLGVGVIYARIGSPVDVNGTAIGMEAGHRHNCAILPSARVACWGENLSGQTGQPAGAPVLAPRVVAGFSNVVDIGLGSSHSCAVFANGRASCVGANDQGQLGTGGLTPVATSQPIAVFQLTSAVRIAAGLRHTCAALEDGSVRCWGRNEYGEVAFAGGTGNTVPFPIGVPGISNAVDVTVGDDHSCALLATGGVTCWGRGLNGRLGNGASTNSNVPVPVSFITTATAVSAGSDHTCVRLAASEIRCWGANARGQLGTGSTTPAFFSTPVNAINDGGALGISSGGEFGCMLATPFARCFGRGTDGQIGNNAFVDRSDPQTVSGINTAVAVEAGQFHACALLTDGSVRCWGDNSAGQLGQATAFGTDSAVPVRIPGISLDAAGLLWLATDEDATAARSGHVWFDDSGENGTFVVAFDGLSSAEGGELQSGADTDGDGVIDRFDNCINVPNANQRDTNGDSFGNICDPDFNGNGIVDSQDGALLKARFGTTTNPDQDLNGNGVVDSQDGSILKARFGQAPGPSGTTQF